MWIKSLILLLLFLCFGCDSEGNYPSPLNRAPKPIKIIAVNLEGVILQDGEGKVYCYNENYHFSQIIIAGGYKTGDILIGSD